MPLNGKGKTMTIHHDKMAYGKLASAREEISEERLLEMLGELAETQESDKQEKEKKICLKTEEN